VKDGGKLKVMCHYAGHCFIMICVGAERHSPPPIATTSNKQQHIQLFSKYTAQSHRMFLNRPDRKKHVLEKTLVCRRDEDLSSHSYSHESKLSPMGRSAL
jgi:hypothetical protein